MHYGFKQEDIMKEIERFFTNENKQSYDGVHDNPTAPSERLLYPDLSSVSERLANEKNQASN